MVAARDDVTGRHVWRTIQCLNIRNPALPAMDARAIGQTQHHNPGVCTPAGMNKMVINHLEKLFVTSDASTIVTELEVQHPAAKLLVMAAKAQESEIGDGTNLVRR